MKKIISVLVLLAVNGYSDDNLKNFLMDKGLINKKEYEEYVKDKNKNGTEINGILTLRYYYLDNKTYSVSRERFLFQIKTEFLKKLNDNLTVNFGFATGDKSKPRSNYEIMGEGFSNKNLNLSLANATFQEKNFKLVAGKFKNNLWQSNSALIDSDINFEGAGFEFGNKNFNFVFDNLFLWEFASSKKDPRVYSFQISNANKYFKFALTYYDFVYVKGVSTSTFSSRPSSPYPLSNSVSNSKYKFDYDIISYDIKSELKLTKNILFSAFANYGLNSSVGEKNKFYIYGTDIFFTDKEYKKASIGFNYRKLENDSFLDIFPDVATYGGATGTESYRFVGCYNLNRNISVVPYYIYSKPLDKNYKKEDAIIVDINVKF
ncbi:MAG: putative porin [Elusimicrobiota bacterium]